MVKSPIIILLELLIGTVAHTIQYLIWIFSKLIELFQSLFVSAAGSFIGLVIAIVIGLIVIFLVKKTIFGSIKIVIFFALILFIILITFAMIIF